MRTPANIARHPIHPMLVPIPIGLWVFSFACDIIAFFVANPGTWKTVALYAMVGGIIGALLAAVFGLIDLLSLPPDIRQTAIMHMSINLLIVVHELGHFLAARWRGLYIEKFGIWFGKPLWKKKINGVEYSLGCIPAGGSFSS